MIKILKSIKFSLVLSITIAIQFSIYGQNRIILNNWTYSIDSQEIAQNINLPNSISDVLNKDTLDKTQFANNEHRLSKVFYLEKEELRSDFIYLNISQIYPNAQVYLNDQLIAEIDNYFDSYRLPLRGILRKVNELNILFRPKFSENEVVYIPSYLDSQIGVNDTLSIDFYNHINVMEDAFTYRIQDNKAELHTTLNFQTKGISDISISQRIDLRRITMWETIAEEVKENVISQRPYSLNNIFEINQPYWYNSYIYGTPKLVLVTEIKSDDQIIYEKRRPLYFRDIKLVKDQTVNGKELEFVDGETPMFIRGVNWHTDKIHVSQNDYPLLLKLMKDAGFDLVRVVGNSDYERDYFYETCDSIGMNVWQDFMFPTLPQMLNDKLFEKIKIQANQEVKRLGHHPSIIIWGGSYEALLSSMRSVAADNTKSENIKIKAQQDRVLQDILPLIVSTSSFHQKYLTIPPNSNESFHKSSSIVYQDELNYQLAEISLSEISRQQELGILNMGLGSKSYGFGTNVSAIDIYKSQLSHSLVLNRYMLSMQAHRSNNSGYILSKFFDTQSNHSNAILDKEFTPKLPYYQLVQDNRRIVLANSIENGKLSWNLVNHYNEPFSPVLNVYKLDSKKGKFKKIISDRTIKLEALENLSLDFSELSENFEENTILIADLAYSNHIYRQVIPVSDKPFAYEPEINISNIKSKRVGDNYELTIDSQNGILYGAIISNSAGYFSENLLTLLPGESKTIIFHPYNRNAEKIEFSLYSLEI